MANEGEVIQEALLGPGENKHKILCRIPKIWLEMMLSGGIAAFNTPDVTIVLQAEFSDSGLTFEQLNDRMTKVVNPEG